MANQEMFRKIDGVLTLFPELHHQTFWQATAEQANRCGTTRCVAGWAVWFKAKEMGLLSRKRDWVEDEVLMMVGREIGLGVDLCAYGRGTAYAELGAALLDLDEDEADDLFQDFNNDRVAARVASYAKTGEDLKV
jgi:hypothetical protein